MKLSQALILTASGIEHIERLLSEQVGAAKRQIRAWYLRRRQRQILFDLKLIQEDIATGPARREIARQAYRRITQEIRRIQA